MYPLTATAKAETVRVLSERFTVCLHGGRFGGYYVFDTITGRTQDLDLSGDEVETLTEEALHERLEAVKEAARAAQAAAGATGGGRPPKADPDASSGGTNVPPVPKKRGGRRGASPSLSLSASELFGEALADAQKNTGQVFYKASMSSTGDIETNLVTFIAQGQRSIVVDHFWNAAEGRFDGKVTVLGSRIYPEYLLKVLPTIDDIDQSYLENPSAKKVEFQVVWNVMQADGFSTTLALPYNLTNRQESLSKLVGPLSFPLKRLDVLEALAQNRQRVPTAAVGTPHPDDRTVRELPIHIRWNASGWVMPARNDRGQLIDPNGQPVPVGQDCPPIHVLPGGRYYSAPGDRVGAGANREMDRIVSTRGSAAKQYQAYRRLLRKAPVCAIALGVAAGSLLNGLPTDEGRILDQYGGFIHFHGQANSGKTMLLLFLASIFGTPNPKFAGSGAAPGILRECNSTSVGVELMAAQLNHACLALDEIQRLNKKPEEIARFWVGMVNGDARLVSENGGKSLRDARTYTTVIVSTGNASIIETARGASNEIEQEEFINALQQRGLEWDVDRYPLYPHHGETGSARADFGKFLDSIRDDLNENHGHLYPALTAYYATHRNRLRQQLETRRLELRQSPSRTIARLNRLIACTEIGIEVMGELVGLSKGEVAKSVAACREQILAMEADLLGRAQEQKTDPVDMFLTWLTTRNLARTKIQGYKYFEKDGKPADANTQAAAAQRHTIEVRDAVAYLAQDRCSPDGKWDGRVAFNEDLRPVLARELPMFATKKAWDDLLRTLRDLKWLNVNTPNALTTRVSMSSILHGKPHMHQVNLSGWAAKMRSEEAQEAETLAGEERAAQAALQAEIQRTRPAEVEEDSWDESGAAAGFPMSGPATGWVVRNGNAPEQRFTDRALAQAEADRRNLALVPPSAPAPIGQTSVPPLPPMPFPHVQGAARDLPRPTLDEVFAAPADADPSAPTPSSAFVAELKQHRDLARTHGMAVADAAMSGDVPRDERGEFDADAFFGPRGSAR